ncbi:MAG: hypothetical protein ACO2ON_02605 [Candidatus Nanopusillus sp.]
MMAEGSPYITNIWYFLEPGLLETLGLYIILVVAMVTLYIIYTIITRVRKKESSKSSDFIINKAAIFLILIAMPVLLVVSYLTFSIFNIYIAMILGIALLFLESRNDDLQFLKEIENNENINKFIKIFIKLSIKTVPFILSIILVYSLALLTIFPLNMSLVNIIVGSIIPIYFLMTVGGMLIFILANFHIGDKKQQVEVKA